MLNQFFMFNINGRKFLTAAAIMLLAIFVAGWFWHPIWWLFVIAGPITVIGVIDMLQIENSIIRNFPFLGHFRYLFLSISPEIRQYFVESNTDGKPFSKNQRDFVNKRSDRKAETHPFGTELDVYSDKYI